MLFNKMFNIREYDAYDWWAGDPDWDEDEEDEEKTIAIIVRKNRTLRLKFLEGFYTDELQEIYAVIHFLQTDLLEWVTTACGCGYIQGKSRLRIAVRIALQSE
jgi:hypothetical protein